MPAIDPLAVRVVRRHVREAAAVLHDVPASAARVEYSKGATITAAELARMLTPKLGVLVDLWFDTEGTRSPNVVRWTAVTAGDDLVSGKLVLRVEATDAMVEIHVEVVVDGRSTADRLSRDVQRRPEGLVTVGEDEEQEPRDDESPASTPGAPRGA